MLRRALLCLVAVAVIYSSAGPAKASVETFGFIVNDLTGPLAGNTYEGLFSFDTSDLSFGFNGATGLLTSLDFAFNGVTYDSTTANTGEIYLVGTNDVPSDIFTIVFGNNCVAGTCSTVPFSNDWFVASDSLSYTLPSTSAAWGGDVTSFRQAMST